EEVNEINAYPYDEQVESEEDCDNSTNEDIDRAVNELNEILVYEHVEEDSTIDKEDAKEELNNAINTCQEKPKLKLTSKFQSLDEFSLKFTRNLLNDWKNPLKRVFTRINCEVSDAGSHDSVDSFLEARKADPETILLNLGFGGSTTNSSYSDTGRIPQRFLQPSKLNGIAFENFLRHQQLLVHSYESGLGGYRGLTGK
ncbi:hypothetical protein WDU94_006227, partial [Cyamophila willieti]